MTSPSPSSGRFLGEGKYELLTPIGLGAMGIVHLARHVALDRVVAVKLLNPGLTARPEAAERFLTEARTASLLRHKNTTHVLDFGGDQQNGFYLVMEYVEGKNLSEVLAEEGTFSSARGIAIASQILAALAEAHEFDIVHRDIKPGNIMLVPWTDDDGREVELVKVLDFGIATMQTGPHWAMKEEVAGTPEYMSPEQAQGLQVDPRSDVYAVGTLLYALVCGEVPFARETPMETMVAQVSSRPRPPRQLAPHLSAEFEQALLRALEKDPAVRFQSARAFRTALLELPEAAVLTTDASSVPAGLMASVPSTRPGIHPAVVAPSPPSRPSRRWILPVAALALGAALLVFQLTSGSPSVTQGTLAAAVPPLERVPAPASAASQSSPVDAARAIVAPDKPTEPATAPADRVVAANDTPPEPGPTTVIVPPSPWPTLPPPEARIEPEPETKAPPAEKREPKKPAHPDAPVALVGPESKPSDTALASAKPIEAKPTDTIEPEAKPAEIDPKVDTAPVASVDVKPPTDKPAVVEPVEDKTADVKPREVDKPAPSLRATAGIGGIAVEGSLPRSSVARALEATWAGLEECYRTAATNAHADAHGSARVSLVIDIDGRARNVSVGALPLPGLQACVTQVIGRVRSKDRPDTGTVGATFKLTFTPRAPP